MLRWVVVVLLVLSNVAVAEGDCADGTCPAPGTSSSASSHDANQTSNPDHAHDGTAPGEDPTSPHHGDQTNSTSSHHASREDPTWSESDHWNQSAPGTMAESCPDGSVAHHGACTPHDEACTDMGGRMSGSHCVFETCAADGFHDAIAQIHDQFRHRYAALEEQWAVGKQAGQEEGWDQATWQAFEEGMAHDEQALEWELMEALKAAEHQWQHEAEACGWEVDMPCPGCAAEQDDRFGSFAMAHEGDYVVVEGKHLRLEGLPEQNTVRDLSCDGRPLLDRVLHEHPAEAVMPHEGRVTSMAFHDAAGEAFLQLHDDAKCTVKIAATPTIGWTKLAMPASLDCHLDGDLRCHGSDHVVVVHVEGHLDGVAEHIYRLEGRAELFMLPDDGEYADALAERRIGAEAIIGHDDDGLATQTVTLGDMDVQIQGEKGHVTAIIESEAGLGKTVSLEFAPGMFHGVPRIEVTEVQPDGSVLALQVRMADSLQDVLDPVDASDDPDTVEAWVVEDADGMHVMLAFYHFSEKRVDLTQELADSAIEGAIEGIQQIPVPFWAPVLALLVLVRRR